MECFARVRLVADSLFVAWLRRARADATQNDRGRECVRMRIGDTKIGGHTRRRRWSAVWITTVFPCAYAAFADAYDTYVRGWRTSEVHHHRNKSNTGSSKRLSLRFVSYLVAPAEMHQSDQRRRTMHGRYPVAAPLPPLPHRFLQRNRNDRFYRLSVTCDFLKDTFSSFLLFFFLSRLLCSRFVAGS